ncbi:DUF4352 domain-containing protein [Spirochaetota bacterium]
MKIKINKLKSFIIIISIVLIFSMLYSNENNFLKTKLRNMVTGESVQVTGIRVTLHAVKHFAYKNPIPDKENEILYILDFTVENHSSEVIMVFEGSEFMLKDESGYKYEHILLENIRGDIGSKILPGEKNRGDIIYSAPKEGKSIKVFFDFADFGQPIAAGWAVDSPANSPPKTRFILKEKTKSMYSDLYYLRKKINIAFEKMEQNKNVTVHYVLFSRYNTELEKGSYLKSAFIGPWMRFDKKGKLVVDGFYEKEEMRKWTEYAYFGDTTTVQRSTPYVSGKIEGTVTEYFESGDVKKKVNMREGIRMGPIKIFYKSGRIKAQANYYKGKLNGSMAFFYETGKYMRVLGFKEDKLKGAVKIYDENGRSTKENEYDLEEDELYKSIIR